MYNKEKYRDLMGGNSSRSSNIELLRILAMMAIVAHHYVVNFSVVELFDPVHPTVNSIFLRLWGMWGKTMIDTQQHNFEERAEFAGCGVMGVGANRANMFGRTERKNTIFGGANQ